MRVSAATRLGSILGIASALLAGCSTTPREDVARLAQISAAIDTKSIEETASAPWDQPRLIARARQRASAGMRVELEGLIDASAFDDQAGLAYPSLSAGAEAGRSLVLRREGRNDSVNLLPNLDWNAVRLLQRKRIAGMRGDRAAITRLRASLAADDAEREAVRRIAALQIAIGRVDAARTRLRFAALAKISMGEEAPVDLEEDAQRELERATLSRDVAGQSLRLLCGLGPADVLAPGSPAEPPLPRESLGAYVAQVLDNNAAAEAVAANAKLRTGAVQAAKAQQWEGFSASAGLGNVLQLLSSPPLALFGFTFQLLDQGAQQRRVLRAQADAALARLDQRDELDRLALVAGQAWMNALDTRAGSVAATTDLARAEKDRAIMRAKFLAHAVEPARYYETERSLAEARASDTARRAEAVMAEAERRLLAGQPQSGHVI